MVTLTFVIETIVRVVHLYAQWKAVEHSIALDNGAIDITVPVGFKAVIKNLPAGLGYSVTEGSLKNWVQIDSSGDVGYVPAIHDAQVEFTNQYQPNAVSVQIVGTKTMDNTGATAGCFFFGLYENGTLLETVANGDGGIVMFRPIAYETPGVHDYVVRELPGSEDTLTYDAREFHVRVSITEEDSDLLCNVEYLDGPIRFTNTTNPGQLLLKKLGENVSNANKDDAFTFRLQLTGNMGQPLNGVVMRKVPVGSSPVID